MGLELTERVTYFYTPTKEDFATLLILINNENTEFEWIDGSSVLNGIEYWKENKIRTYVKINKYTLTYGDISNVYQYNKVRMPNSYEKGFGKKTFKDITWEVVMKEEKETTLKRKELEEGNKYYCVTFSNNKKKYLKSGEISELFKNEEKILLVKEAEETIFEIVDEDNIVEFVGTNAMISSYLFKKGVVREVK